MNCFIPRCPLPPFPFPFAGFLKDKSAELEEKRLLLLKERLFGQPYLIFHQFQMAQRGRLSGMTNFIFLFESLLYSFIAY